MSALGPTGTPEIWQLTPRRLRDLVGILRTNGQPMQHVPRTPHKLKRGVFVSLDASFAMSLPVVTIDIDYSAEKGA